jgi:hypothetical protein
MNAISIGIQVIRPTTATTPQSAPQQQANDHDVDDVSIAANEAPPPPPKGMGKFVDKYV